MKGLKLYYLHENCYYFDEVMRYVFLGLYFLHFDSSSFIRLICPAKSKEHLQDVQQKTCIFKDFWG